jgi:hypothetical protein
MPTAIGIHAWSSVLGPDDRSVTPVELLAQSLADLALDPHDIESAVVGCATPVGAQASGLGRFALAAAGWPMSIVTSAVDGGQLASLIALGSAHDRVVAAGGRTRVVAAGVEVTSTVPRGAATVRDYGRPPGPPLPELHLAEELAARGGLGAESIATLATKLVGAHSDGAARPVLAADGRVCAAALAPEADAAASVLIGAATGAEPVLAALAIVGGPLDDLVGASLAAARAALVAAALRVGDLGALVVVDDQLVSVDALVTSLGVPATLADGSSFCHRFATAPGADALRAMARACDLVTAGAGPTLVVVRGPLGLGGAAVVASPSER